MSRTRIVLSTAAVLGGLLVAAVPALAQSTGHMLMQQGGSPMASPTMTAMMSSGGMMGEQGMMDMHGQVAPEQLARMQQFHAQMPAELRDQMQAWHQQQGMTGMMSMMHAQGPAAMHAQMPQELQDQMRAWYAQLPDDTRAQMQAMHESMVGMHGGQATATCPFLDDDASPSGAPAEDTES